MKESYRNGITNHPDPESCGVGRKAALEALTGAHAGRGLSCEIKDLQRADDVAFSEGYTSGGDAANVYGLGESDGCVVPTKGPNNDGGNGVGGGPGGKDDSFRSAMIHRRPGFLRARPP